VSNPFSSLHAEYLLCPSAMLLSFSALSLGRLICISGPLGPLNMNWFGQLESWTGD
jgi:hypothetical protein